MLPFPTILQEITDPQIFIYFLIFTADRYSQHFCSAQSCNQGFSLEKCFLPLISFGMFFNYQLAPICWWPAASWKPGVTDESNQQWLMTISNRNAHRELPRCRLKSLWHVRTWQNRCLQAFCYSPIFLESLYWKLSGLSVNIFLFPQMLWFLPKRVMGVRLCRFQLWLILCRLQMMHHVRKSLYSVVVVALCATCRVWRVNNQ